MFMNTKATKSTKKGMEYGMRRRILCQSTAFPQSPTCCLPFLPGINRFRNEFRSFFFVSFVPFVV